MSLAAVSMDLNCNVPQESLKSLLHSSTAILLSSPVGYLAECRVVGMPAQLLLQILFNFECKLINERDHALQQVVDSAPDV